MDPLRRDAERIQKALERARETIELPFRGAGIGASFFRLPYYVRTGSTPLAGFETWLKVMEGQLRTTRWPWVR